jgi:hypothetical protein
MRHAGELRLLFFHFFLLRTGKDAINGANNEAYCDVNLGLTTRTCAGHSGFWVTA